MDWVVQKGADSMSNKVFTIDRTKEIVKPIALKYRVEGIYLFDSYARNEATTESNLDFLVFGGRDFKLTMIFSLAKKLHEAFQKEADVFETHKVNRKSTFFDTITRERLLVA